MSGHAPLTANEVRAIVRKRAAAAASKEPAGMAAGAARSLVECGASTAAVAIVGRWKDPGSGRYRTGTSVQFSVATSVQSSVAKAVVSGFSIPRNLAKSTTILVLSTDE